MTRPSLHEAVAGQKSKASEYNENFNLMMGYVEDTCSSAVATVTNKADKSYVDTKLADVKTTTDSLQTSINTVSGKVTTLETTVTNKSYAPNYSAGYSVSSGFTASTDGFIYVRATSDVRVYVDGTQIFDQWSQGSYKQCVSPLLPIAKGNVVTFSGGSATYYPIKGA